LVIGFMCKYVDCFQEVENVYGGVIKMLDTGDKLKVDQSYLQTVIPAIGSLYFL